MSVRSDWLLVLFKSIFSIIFLSTFSVYYWKRIVSLFLLLVLSIFSSYILRIYYLIHTHFWLLCLPGKLLPFSLWNVPPYLWQSSCFKYLPDSYWHSHTTFPVLTLHMIYFPYIYFQFLMPRIKLYLFIYS